MCLYYFIFISICNLNVFGPAVACQIVWGFPRRTHSLKTNVWLWADIFKSGGVVVFWQILHINSVFLRSLFYIAKYTVESILYSPYLLNHKIRTEATGAFIQFSLPINNRKYVKMSIQWNDHRFNPLCSITKLNKNHWMPFPISTSYDIY